MSLETDADAFHARDIFDPDSLYARMRARYDPELKRRGQFYSWEAIRMEAKVRPILAAAAASHGSAKSDDKGPLVVAMFADEPERDVPVELHGRFSRTSAARKYLFLSMKVRDELDRPPRFARCRTFVITPGVSERLCGPSPDVGPDAFLGSKLHLLFEGRGPCPPRETCAVLAAIAEFDGEFDEAGNCKFPPFELPSQAGDFDAFPAETVLVAVMEGPGRS